jgi:hypothetical protein
LRQIYHKEVRSLEHSVDINIRFAKIDLSVPGRMLQRNEHLLTPLFLFPHVILHHRVAAQITVFVPQPFKYPLDVVPKSTGNSKLLQGIHLRDCISYVLSLPVHCLALGCTTIGPLEDDVRIAQQFKPLTEAQMAELRKAGAQFKGPQTEDWRRNVQTASAGTHRDGDSG